MSGRICIVCWHPVRMSIVWDLWTLYQFVSRDISFNLNLIRMLYFQTVDLSFRDLPVNLFLSSLVVVVVVIVVAGKQ